LTSRSGGPLEESLREIVPPAIKRRVPILIEATNRYESSVANALNEAFDVISGFDQASLVQILPDTFHMNIEEKDPFVSLRKHKGRYPNIHISDNNRFFPGYRTIRFADLFDLLRSMDYAGTVTIEGNVKEDLLSDIHAAMRTFSRSCGPNQSGRV
jgi:D-psicose/D-tagatose/L-ribulose 3-epimerase